MRAGRLAGFVVAATVVGVPNVGHAAVPKTGPWDSGSRTSPTVSFDVRGPVSKRNIQRVSVPLACRGQHSPTGWATSDPIAQVRADGRFKTNGDSFVIRGRFVRPGRARVVVHSDDGSCTAVRRFVVRHKAHRTPVRSGSFLSLVGGGTARAFLEVSAFGRMVHVMSLEGAVSATCSDGSQRSLPLGGPEDLVLAGPIKPTGRFDVPDLAGSPINISGSFDGGAVAALVDRSSVLPGGVSCQARGVTLVGSLAFPRPPDSGSIFPGPPAVRESPQG